MPQKMPQMSFAQIGTLYNSISNELEGGVTQQNQPLLLQQISTVQTQLQGLIDKGTFNKFVDADGANATIVHAQNIADQMSFLTKVVGTTFGTDSNAPPKYINDVIRDVQDIVVGDDNLAALAQKGNHSGFQQVSHLLTDPTPFPDSGVQTQTLLQFIEGANSLAERGVAAIGMDPNSDTVKQLITDINTVGANISTYSNEQGGVFAARFNNEFGGVVPDKSGGVHGTASAELIKGLETGDAALIKGAAAVMVANAGDVRGNMLAQGDVFTPAPNFGIPDVVDNVHTAGIVFNDAVTKLIGGVYDGNQASIVADLNATQKGLQDVIDHQGISGRALKDLQHVVSLLGQESSLVGGIDTAAPTPVSQVNGQIGQLQAEILSIVNHNQKLAHLAAGANGDTAGFAALPPTAHPGHNNLPAMVDAAMANLASPPAAMGAAAAGANIPAAANPAPAALSPTSPAAADHAAIDMAHANLDTIHQQIIPHLHDHLV